MGELLVPALIGVGTGVATSAALKKPKAVAAPALPKEEPVETAELETLAGEAGEEERKRARRRRGKQKTVITGELVPVTEKKRLLSGTR